VPILGHIAKRRIERSPAVRDLVEETARILALTKMLDRLPKTLSGGQRQRVALGRAMVRKPQVFLMDEPLSNLDAKLRTAMRAELINLHRNVGGTFVYVTHDQVEAMTMGTRIALMRDGVVQQFATTREIYAAPINTYVARFIGTPPMNLLEAKAESAQLRVGEVALPLPNHLQNLASGSALLGLRPTAVSIMSPGEPATLSGSVALVEHIGAESLISVRLDAARNAHDDQDGPRDQIMVIAPGYSDLCPGDRVGLSLDMAEAVLFSAETGQRLIKR